MPTHRIGPPVLHRLRTPTRAVAGATAAAALVAIADVVDTSAGALWAVPLVLLLGLGVLAMLRLAASSVEVRDTVVIVRNVTRTHVLDRVDVVGFEAGTWNSRVVLADGTIVLSLLRAQDVGAIDLGQPHDTVITLDVAPVADAVAV